MNWFCYAKDRNGGRTQSLMGKVDLKVKTMTRSSYLNNGRVINNVNKFSF